MRNIAISTLLALLIGSAAPFVTPVVNAQTAAEAGFNMNYVIGDDQMTDYLSMSLGRIQEFLNSQPGVLKSLTVADGRTAAQVIYDAAVTNQISPKVLLVTIQKESSMITKSSFNTSSYSGSQQYYLDWITFYGWCDTCSSGVNKGFVNQINSTAAAFRRYLNLITSSGTSISGWGPNVAKGIPCISSDYANSRQLCTPGTTVSITPLNAATSALYTYTPHPGGNYAFWLIWKSFGFNMRRVYPDGTLLQAKGSKDVYIIQNGQKRRFSSQNALLATYSLKKIITVSADALMQYDTGSTIYFANYSLVTAPNRGVYLIANDVKRPIKSKAALLAIGIDPKSATKAGWDVLNQFPDGPAITTSDIYPAGAIVQNTKNGMIFYVKDGIKYPVPSGDIYKSQFGTKKPIKLKPEVIDTYTWGGFVGFRDGELVQSKTGGAVYFISNGYRLPIASRDAAKAYGFDKIMGNLIKTNDKSIEVHPVGPALDVDSSMVSIASR
jgi:hypothetical protein